MLRDARTNGRLVSLTLTGQVQPPTLKLDLSSLSK
jgi:hypothetical protein